MNKEKIYVSNTEEFSKIYNSYNRARKQKGTIDTLEKMLKTFYFSDDILDELSKSFISELEWMILTENQILSEAFMTKHSDYVDWVMIASWQKFSEQFFYDNYLNLSSWIYLVLENDKLDWKKNENFVLFLKINGLE
jgi:hypothetical protein